MTDVYIENAKRFVKCVERGAAAVAATAESHFDCYLLASNLNCLPNRTAHNLCALI